MSLFGIFSRCKICFNDMPIPRPQIVEDNLKFLAEALSSGNNHRIMCLHTGNDVVLSLISVMSGILCISTSNSSPEDVVSSLQKGDKVVYGKARGIFEGIDDTGKAIIKQSKALTNHIPSDRFYLIRPYHGTATSLDGRGIRDMPSKRRGFLSGLLGLEESLVPIQIPNHIVIVCEKDIADYIASDITVIGPNNVSMPFCHIFPSAYYSLSRESFFSGNVTKAEPIVKFTNSVSRARELIIESNLHCCALFISGHRIFEAGKSELQGLSDRKSLPMICVFGKIQNNYMPFLKQTEDWKLYAWTKSVIKTDVESSLFDQEENENKHIPKLNKQLITFVHSSVETIEMDSPVYQEKYQNARHQLFELANTHKEEYVIANFVIKAFSLFKLLNQAVFTLKTFETSVKDGKISSLSPQKQLANLQKTASSMRPEIANSMIYICHVLGSIYEELYHKNPKFDYLVNELLNSSLSDKIIVVTPKVYYGRLFANNLGPRSQFLLKRIVFTTPRKTLATICSERTSVIMSGAFDDNDFNPYSLVGQNLRILSYPHEQDKLQRLRRIHDMMMHYYDMNNLAICRQSLISQEGICESKAILFPNGHLDDMEDIVKQLVTNNLQINTQSIDAHADSRVNISRIAMFETGEMVYFTKNYRAYVLDEEEESVDEVDIENLSAGDVLIFSKRNEQTKDVVDLLLQRLISYDSGKGLKNAYSLSKLWKKELQQFRTEHNLTYNDISKLMASAGCPRHAVTVRSWLDDDSHIVGPREIEAYRAISAIIDSSSLLGREKEVYDACKQIRSIRTKVLDYIAKKSISAIISQNDFYDPMLNAIENDILDLADIIQIEWITDVEDLQVPFYISNHPYHQYQPGS